MGFKDVLDRAFNLAGEGFGAVKGGLESVAGSGWESFSKNLPQIAGGGGGGALPPLAGGGGGSNLPPVAGGGGFSSLPSLAGGVSDPFRSQMNVEAGQAAYERWHPNTKASASKEQQNTSYASGTGGASTGAAGASGWLEQQRPDSPVVPIADEAAQYAVAKGVDPGLLFGLLRKESQFGADGALGIQNNNPGNIMGAGADPANGKIILQSFPSLLDGVKAMVDLLAGYGQTYGAKTIEDMVAIYYVGPEAYKRYGLDANDAGGRGPGGNGTVRDYLNQHIYPVMQSYGNRPGAQLARGGGGDAVAKVQQFMGLPYTNEGIRHTGNPQDGFDCSSLTGWALGLPTTMWNAQAQFDASQKIADMGQLQPGDLVFFQGTVPPGADPTARPVTHVGIYVGNGRMINAQDNGVQDVDITSGYWRDHYYAGGRLR